MYDPRSIELYFWPRMSIFLNFCIFLDNDASVNGS